MGNRKLRLPFVGVDWGHRSRIFACSSDKVKQIESRVEDVFRRLYWNVKEVFYCGCSSLWKSILIMKWWKVFNVSRVLLDKSLSCIYREKIRVKISSFEIQIHASWRRSWYALEFHKQSRLNTEALPRKSKSKSSLASCIDQIFSYDNGEVSKWIKL